MLALVVRRCGLGQSHSFPTPAARKIEDIGRRPYTSAIKSIYASFSEEKKVDLANLAKAINSSPKTKYVTHLMLKMYEQLWLSNLFVKARTFALRDMTIPKEGTFEMDVFIAFVWGNLMREPEEVRVAIIYYQHFLQTDPELLKAYDRLSGIDTTMDIEYAKKKVLDSFDAVKATPCGVRMIQLLIAKGRLRDIETGLVLKVFEQFKKEITKRVDVKLTTPYVLNDHELKFYENMIANMFESKVCLNLSTLVDESIGGGHIMVVEGETLDYSWKTQHARYIETLRQAL